MYQVGFVIEQVLGHVTHGQNLQKYVARDLEIQGHWVLPAWDARGWGTHIPVYKSNWTVQAGLKARHALAGIHQKTRLDGLFFHTQTTAVLAQDWLERVPGIVSLDATPLQYDALGLYYDHSSGPSWLERLKTRLTQGCFQKARKLVTWSDWARQSLIADYGIPADKIAVIPPGVDPQEWAPDAAQSEPHSSTRILFVGGDLQRKGGPILIEAFRQLKQSFPSGTVELHLVTRDAVPAEEGVYVYHDMQPNSQRLRDLYHSCDVFCLPTQGDCLPMVLSEAGAAGLPLISTRIAAIPEIVIDGQTGCTIQAGDAQAIFQALRNLIEHPDLRQRWGMEARRVVARQFDAGKNAGKLLGLIQETIDEAKIAKR